MMAAMLLHDLVETSGRVAATSKRSEKTALLADLLGRVEPADVESVVGMLTGEPRQGKIGVGWALLSGLDVPPAAGPSITIGRLDATIDEVAAASGPGSTTARADHLATLYADATAAEQEFISRLLIGELRQGALGGLMADSVAKAAGVPAAVVRRAAMLSGDLNHAAVLGLTQGREALEAVGLEVLRPVQPMLAATAADVATAMAELGRVSIEWKLDGIRVQVHRRGDQVLVVTRNLNDVTDRLPEVVALARNFTADAFVLDGEAIGLNEDQRPERFQDTASRFGTEDRGAYERSLHARFFDLLHLDGTDLIDQPLADRLTALRTLVGDHAMPGEITDDLAVAQRVEADALGQGHEGVMVKAIDSPYLAGRRGKTWRKVKPVRTLDLVVLAAEWGHGRRTGWLSNLHLGARAEDGFVMVGKTFKGLTDDLLRWQTDELQTRQREPDADEPETRTNVVFVRPELVVEIAVDGVQSSTRYPGGVALRFARVKGYRPDKKPADADTIETVQALL